MATEQPYSYGDPVSDDDPRWEQSIQEENSLLDQTAPNPKPTDEGKKPSPIQATDAGPSTGPEGPYDQYAELHQVLLSGDADLIKQHLIRQVLASQPSPLGQQQEIRQALDTIKDKPQSKQAAELLNELPQLIYQAAHTPRVPLVHDLSVPAPPRKWLINGWLACNRVLLFTGPGDRGKSWIATQLLYALMRTPVQGPPGHLDPVYQPVFERTHPTVDNTGFTPAVSGIPCMLVSWEDEGFEVRRRLDAQQADPAIYTPLLKCLDANGCGPMWEPEHLPGGRGRGLSLRTAAHGQLSRTGHLILQEAQQHQAKLLVLDNVAALFGHNENDRSQVREFISAMDRWGRDHGCAIILVAHPSKNDAEYSGSTDWRNAVRGLWTLNEETVDEPIGNNGKTVKRETGQFKLECTKCSYGPAPEPIILERQSNGTFKQTVPGVASTGPASSPSNGRKKYGQRNTTV